MLAAGTKVDFDSVDSWGKSNQAVGLAGDNGQQQGRR